MYSQKRYFEQAMESMPNGSIIAAGHPLTAEAAAHALKTGGNAFDAALTGWLASCLCEPVLTSPGGGGFAMVSPASGKPRLYDFFTQTPIRRNASAKTIPLEANFGTTRQVFHLGAGSIATPGCVAGMLRLHEDLGKLPFKECAEPALDLARNGLEITSHAEELLRVVSDLYLSTNEARRVFESKHQEGTCLREGEAFRNHDMVRFLEMLVSEGARWFYEGDIGRMCAEFSADHGGHLVRQDFIDYRLHIREPLKIVRKGASIWLNPPPSMGGTLIAIGLSLNEPDEKTPFPYTSRDDWEQWIEPLRIMSLVRSNNGTGELTGMERDRLSSVIQANPVLSDAVAGLLPHALQQIRANGTTQLSIMDSLGNEISMTTSNGAGSAVILPGTGFMMNNMLGEEDLQPEGLGTWKTNSRLSSMMAPLLAELPDGTRLATGSGGSNRIRSTLLQILRHLLDRGCSIEEAVELPRLHWENGELHAESAAARTLDSIGQAFPWPLITHEVPNLYFGGAHSIARTSQGELRGIGDPRRGGVCLHV